MLSDGVTIEADVPLARVYVRESKVFRDCVANNDVAYKVRNNAATASRTPLLRGDDFDQDVMVSRGGDATLTLRLQETDRLCVLVDGAYCSFSLRTLSVCRQPHCSRAHDRVDSSRRSASSQAHHQLRRRARALMATYERTFCNAAAP